MIQEKHFSQKQIERILADQLEDHEIAYCESHLQECTVCQTSLAARAGDDTWWKRTRTHLSSAEIRMPPRGSDSKSKATPLDHTSIHRPGEVVSVPIDTDSPLAAPRHPELLGKIGDFDVEEAIGQGGMGVVYKAYDQDLKRAVAIKVLAPHLAANGVARRRFAREAQAAAAVVHPNVVPIYSVNTSAQPFIVMALASGKSLHEWVVERGPMEPKDIVRIAKQIAAGLSAAHRLGLIHRDIKPANILLERDVSRVMITDFGLARATDDVAVTQTGWLAGTPHYMSPEQAQGEDLDAKSDLFSLGSVMYFLATGREPFRAEKPFAVLQKIISKTPLPANRLNSEIPNTLTRIIGRLLEKRPDDRFDSAADLESILERYLAHLQNPTGDTKPRIINKRQRRTRLLAFLTTAMSAIVATSLFLLATITTNSTSTSATGSDATENTEFNSPEALQPFGDWVEDIQTLSRQISEFERRTQHGPGERSPNDPLTQSLHQLDQDIQKMERITAPFFP